MFATFKKNLLKGDNYLRITSLRYLPRWTILLIDIFLVYISLELTDLLLSRFNVPHLANLIDYKNYVLILGVNMIFMYIFKTFSGVIRHSTYFDIQKIFFSSFLTLLVLASVKYFAL